MTRFHAPSLRNARGFTLVELIMTIVVMGIASAALISLQPKVFAAQTTGRDQVAGLEIQRACAERLLAVRRTLGYANVIGSLSATPAPTCNALGGIGGFDANPVVSLIDASAATITSCSSATCTATIKVTKSGVAIALPALTLQLSNY